MRVMSLFAGIGGFDLAAKHMGWETAVQVELDEFCRKVLAKNFPNATRYGDINQFDGRPYTGTIDLICGGFPCQPYSIAGKRAGSADNRDLWPAMFRVIQQVAPRWVLGENVGGFLSWGGGVVFEQVLADLESEGYQVQTFVIPACSVDAPHKRERVWIVAYRDDRQCKPANGPLRPGRHSADGSGSGTDANANGIGQQQPERSLTKVGRRPGHGSSQSVPDADIGPKRTVRGESGKVAPQKPNHCDAGGTGYAAYPDGQRTGTVSQAIQRRELEFSRSAPANTPGPGCRKREPACVDEKAGQPAGRDSSHWSDWPTQPPLCAGDDGLSSGLDRTPDWRAATRWRNQTIKAAGNAVVWQVVYEFFKAI